MRKFTVAIVALFAIIAFTASAYAANTVQVTLTSPTITKTGCEKAGAVTFGFEAGSFIAVGDYWYMDLPSNVTFCKAIDYIVVNGTGLANGARVKATDLSFGYFGANMGIGKIGTANVGVLTGVLTGSAGNTQVAAYSSGNIAFRVKADSGSRRLYLYAIGGATTSSPHKITVNGGYQLNIKVLDGKAWNAEANSGGSGTADSSNTLIITDAIDSDSNFGEVISGINEHIDDAAVNSVPHVQNTLCLNAASLVGDLVYVSFASKSDKFTFTGDSQIAHAGSTSPISLRSCKGLTTGDILIGGQGQCSFAYETTISGYCTGTGQFAGNRILVNTTTTFGDTDDKFDIVLTSTTAGTYFTTDPTLKSFITSEDQCTAAGTAIAPTWVKYVGTTLYTGSYPGTTCATTTSNRVSTVRTTGGAFALNSPIDDLWIDLPPMTYDTTIIGAGTAATISASLEKYPCGEMFTGAVTLGTYVTACASSTSSSTTTLRFPFMTAFDGSAAPWWSGFVITNHSSAAGTAVLTFLDVNGNTATYTTPSIAAGKQFNSSSITVANLTQSTTDAGGNFGSAHYAVTAVCAFGTARGFVFMGNGEEGTGYVVND